MDITKPGACEKLAEVAGDVDILVNNAGVIPSGTLFDVTEPKWREDWELKVFGYINLCRLVYPKMKARGGGVIINNIGNGGEVFDPQYIAGTSGNAALMAFTRALGGHSLDDNIRVMGVNPGPVNTDRIYNMLKKRARTLFGDEARYKELEARYPVWPKYSNGGRTCTSEGDRACRSAELGRRVAKRLPRLPRSPNRIAQNRSSGIEPLGVRSRRLLMVIAQEPAQSLAALNRLQLGPGIRVTREQQDVTLPLVVPLSMIMFDVFV
jgi:NAD(P)-dependent dehydrogenase (short-subunit alcohol dehydrogenase family)